MIPSISTLVDFFIAADHRLRYCTNTDSQSSQIGSMRSKKSRVKSRKGIGTYHHQSQDNVEELVMSRYRVPW